MNLSQKEQEKIAIISECERNLRSLKDLTNKKSSEIASLLGLHYRTIYGCENKESGSKPLLFALKNFQLLLEMGIENQRLKAAMKVMAEQLAGTSSPGVAAPLAALNDFSSSDTAPPSGPELEPLLSEVLRQIQQSHNAGKPHQVSYKAGKSKPAAKKVVKPPSTP